MPNRRSKHTGQPQEATGPQLPDPAGDWDFHSWVQFTLGDATHEYHLSRRGDFWSLTLDDYEGEGDDGKPMTIRGTEFGWTSPDEFWTRVTVLDDHQVMHDDVLRMFLDAGDPALDELVASLEAYEEPAVPPPAPRPVGQFKEGPPAPCWATKGDAVSIPGGLVLLEPSRERAFVYDSATAGDGSWTSAFPLDKLAGRTGRCMATMADGRVLIAGGDGEHGHRIDVFDPHTGIATSGLMLNHARTRPLVFAFDGQHALVVGGRAHSGYSAATVVSTELVDLRSGRSVNYPGSYEFRGLASHLGGGRVLSVLRDETHVVDVLAGTVEPGPAFAPLPEGLRRWPKLLLALANGTTFVWSGVDTVSSGIWGVHSSWAVLDLACPVTTEHHVDNRRRRPAGGASAIQLDDGRVLIIGGDYPMTGERPFDCAIVVDPVSGSLDDVGPMLTGRAEAALVSIADGRVFIAGGCLDHITEFYQPQTDGAAETRE